MADLSINPHRYQRRIQKNRQAEQKSAAAKSAGSAEGEKPSEQADPPKSPPSGDRMETRRSHAEKQMDQCRVLVRWLQEEDRRRLEEKKHAKPPQEKRPSSEELQAKILKMRSKLRRGGRLSSEERAYLARFAPGELAKLRQAEREGEAFKVRLSGCRSKEEAEHAYQGACTSALKADPQDPDISAVIIGQITAALRDMGEKPTKAQLRRQDTRERLRLDRRA